MKDRKLTAWFQGWAVTRKGGPGSGNWGHKGVPGQRGGSASGGGAGGVGLAGAETDPLGTNYHWIDEETIKGDIVVTDFDGSGDDVSDEELSKFIKHNMGESEDPYAMIDENDIEELTITKRDNGPGYIVATYTVIPTEEAGESWIEMTEGIEERGTWRH